VALREAEKRYTVDELWTVITAPEHEGRRLELDNGVIVDMGASSKLNTVIAGRVIHFLNSHVLPAGLGVVTSPDAGFRLGTRTYLQPDAAFISGERGLDLDGTYFTTAPDLAVEVASDDEDVFKKAKEYIHAGTRIVWVIYPREQVVNVFTPAAGGEYRVQEFTISDVLPGGDVLPGFALAIRDLFP
jgi:Uma2 family endonuclease